MIKCYIMQGRFVNKTYTNITYSCYIFRANFTNFDIVILQMSSDDGCKTETLYNMKLSVVTNKSQMSEPWTLTMIIK